MDYYSCARLALNLGIGLILAFLSFLKIKYKYPSKNEMPSVTQNSTKTYDIRHISGVVVLFGLGMLGVAFPSLCEEVDGSIGFAPVRIGYATHGKIDYLLRYNKVNNSQKIEQQYGWSVTGDVRAETFFWQPWLLRVGSNVELTIGNRLLDRSRNNSLKMVRTNEAPYEKVSGGVNFRLLPRSRFPLIARFTRSDFRREIGLIGVQTNELVDQLEISQTYRTPRGGGLISGSYKRTRRANKASQVRYEELWSLDSSLLLSPGQTIRISSVRTRQKNDFLNGSAQSDTLSARHVYRNSEIAFGTMAIRQESRPGTKLLQYNTIGSWRPYRSGLTVTGGLRLYEFLAVTNDKTSYTGANLGASYALNKWLRLFGSININDSEGVQSVSSSTIGNISAAAQHHFTPLELWGYNYTRYVAATVANTTALSNEGVSNNSSTNNSQIVSSRMQHSIRGADIFSLGGSTVISQDLYVVARSRINPQLQLNHTSTFIKRMGKSRIHLNGKDSRDLNGSGRFFQSMSLQGRQRESLSSTSSLSGTATIRAVRTGFDAGPGPTQTSLTSSAALLYRNLRAFNVVNMFVSSDLRLNSGELSGKLSGVNPSENRGRYVWDSRLKYRVGKLEFEGQILWEEARSTNSLNILLHALRYF